MLGKREARLHITIQGVKIVVTQSIIDRFNQVWTNDSPNNNSLKDPKRTFLRLFNGARKIKNTSKVPTQVSKNRDKESEYWHNNNWWFIVNKLDGYIYAVTDIQYFLQRNTNKEGIFITYGALEAFEKAWDVRNRHQHLDNPEEHLLKMIKSSQKKEERLNAKGTIIQRRHNSNWWFTIKINPAKQTKKLIFVESIMQEVGVKFRKRALIIKQHALERFEERWNRRNPNKPLCNSIEKLMRILKRAEVETLPENIRFKRLLNNHAQDAEYWRNEDWRFVTVKDGSDDAPKLVTVEINDY